MKKTVFHGTTYQNYLSIIENGFDKQISTATWDVSDDSMIYLWDLSKCEEYDTEEENRNFLIRSAIESAQITAAVNNETDNRLVVLEMEIDDELLEDDWSCENMSYSSCVHESDIDSNNISTVYDSYNYNPSWRLFYLQGLTKNRNIILESFLSDAEIRAIEALNDAQFYFEDILDVEWAIN